MLTLIACLWLLCVFWSLGAMRQGGSRGGYRFQFQGQAARDWLSPGVLVDFLLAVKRLVPVTMRVEVKMVGLGVAGVQQTMPVHNYRSRQAGRRSRCRRGQGASAGFPCVLFSFFCPCVLHWICKGRDGSSWGLSRMPTRGGGGMEGSPGNNRWVGRGVMVGYGRAAGPAA